jgi:CheY-like chemotaxis protein
MVGEQQQLRVLVVDDEPNIVDVVSMALGHNGFDVEAADTGSGALSKVREWRPHGIPSVSMEEPSFHAGWHLFRCWRGPAWINTAWLLVPGLKRHGYAAEADRIVAALLSLVERHGFREYCNPLNGEGLAGRRFGLSTLLVDLLPADRNRPIDAGSDPFYGSVRGELWAMGAEAASETRRILARLATDSRRRRA